MSINIKSPVKQTKPKKAVKTAPVVPIIDSKTVQMGDQVQNIPVLVNDSMTVSSFRWDTGLDSLRAGTRNSTSDSFIADKDMMCSQITINLYARSNWAGMNRDVKSGRFEFLINGEVVYTIPIEGEITVAGVQIKISDKIIPPQPFIIKKGSVLEIKGVIGVADNNAEYFFTSNMWVVGVALS